MSKLFEVPEHGFKLQLCNPPADSADSFQGASRPVALFIATVRMAYAAVYTIIFGQGVVIGTHVNKKINQEAAPMIPVQGEVL
jgi:hypothetical protein